ncbi:type IV pilin [Haloarchaeobius amylolyticus]|uniref:Type IV pilin n=1 Tax=Haloarchaeobius amylolyticus TaxID=1198296 RepID=A0ABD6BCP7_9EURY
MLDGKSIQRKLVGNDDERAVSPVIGVILMVAITVILAAVIAAFVLDMGQGQTQNPQAGFDVTQENDTHSEVQIVSIDRLDSAEVTCDSNSNTASFDNPGVGNTTSIECNDENVSITGTYEGTSNVMN